MKKLTLLAAAALATAGMAQAATIGNPADPKNEGYYIVAYDLANGKWCEANPEIDETFVFAIDFTGTGLEDAMKTLPSPNRANILGRSGAFDIFNHTNLGEEGAVAKADGRLFPIDRDKNLYGMTVNLYQLITSRLNDAAFGPNADYTAYKVCEVGQDFEFADNVFAFGWTVDNPGAEWWDGIGAPVQDVLQWKMAAYTGTKTGKAFTYGELHPADHPCPLEGLDPAAYDQMCKTWGGYGTPADYEKVGGSDAIETISNDNNSEVVASQYFDLTGRQIENPAEGTLVIRRDTRANGTVTAVKVIR